jgi:TRAP-type C4-dicarboxylate transport system permease small subunit
MLALFGLLVLTGIEAVGYNDAVRTVALQIPLSWVIWLIPAGFLLSAIFLLEVFVQDRRRRQTSER